MKLKAFSIALMAPAALLLPASFAHAQFEAPGGATGQQQAQQRAAPAANAVAMVNNEPITQSEFQTALQAHLKRAGKSDPQAVQQAQQQVMSGLVESRLVEQHLIKEGPEVPKEEVKQVIDQYKKQMQAQGVGFDQFLQSSGYSEEALQRRIKGSLAWRKYQEKEMTEENLQQHFSENEDQFPADDFEQAKPLVAQSYANTLWAEIVEEARPKAEIQVKPLGQAAPVGQGVPQQQP